jgi:predicted metal-dependent hydrolase
VSRSPQIALPFDGPADPPIQPTRVVVSPIGFDRPAKAGPYTDGPAKAGPYADGHHLTLSPMYFVRHRRARRYLLRVEPDGRLRVTIPRGGSRREAEAFVQRNGAWVAQQRARTESHGLTLTADERAALRRQAVEELPPRLRALADEFGVAGLTRISIRNQRTRWGSCGRDGHITLNWRLVLMPPAVRDYVLIHELMHLRRMDHSPAYWRLVANACPAYADARTWLRTHGRGLR